MVPLVGASKPAIIRSTVVLPDPDGPSMEKNSPSAISRSTPATASVRPKDLRRFCNRMAIPSMGGTFLVLSGVGRKHMKS